jgi:hypothetical protein
MGFNQSSAKSTVRSSVLSGDLFSAVITGCLAGIGIWTKPSPRATSLSLSLSLSTKAELTKSSTTAASNVYPLRVIRVKDANPHFAATANSPKMAGRMVISGRMADVCAELDRLAA